MAFARASIVRGAFRAARTSRPSVVTPQLWRQIGRRGYASGGHESTKAGGDLPWMIGAVGVTVPTCWYLMQNAPEAAHGHDDHGADHGKEHAEEGGDEAESKDESEDEKAEDSDSEDQGKEADTPDTSDDEDDGVVVTKTKEEGETDETRKHIPDAKGGAKKRIEGAEGVKQGVADDEDEDPDKPAASKSAGDQNTTSGKQEGLSNTDTKHSSDLAANPDKSTKGEGSPETSKLKGTVDPNRPQK